MNLGCSDRIRIRPYFQNRIRFRPEPPDPGHRLEIRLLFFCFCLSFTIVNVYTVNRNYYAHQNFSKTFMIVINTSYSDKMACPIFLLCSLYKMVKTSWTFIISFNLVTFNFIYIYIGYSFFEFFFSL